MTFAATLAQTDLVRDIDSAEAMAVPAAKKARVEEPKPFQELDVDAMTLKIVEGKNDKFYIALLENEVIRFLLTPEEPTRITWGFDVAGTTEQRSFNSGVKGKGNENLSIRVELGKEQAEFLEKVDEKMLGLFGTGSIAAALVIGCARRHLSSEAVITLASLAFVVAQMVLANAHSLLAAAPATFIAGAGWVTGLTTINVAMQMRSPDAILGRLLSIYQAVTFGGMAIGSWVWGAVADWQGLAFALHTADIFLLISLGILRIAAPMPPSESHRIA